MVAMQESSVPSSNVSCAICHRAISLTVAGVLRCPLPWFPSSALHPSLSYSYSRSAIFPSRGHQGGSSSQPLQPTQPTQLPPKCSAKIIKRIPRASRELARAKQALVLETVARVNDHASWDRLLRFCSSRCFRAPSRGGHRRSMATAVNRQLHKEVDLPPTRPKPSLAGQTIKVTSPNKNRLARETNQSLTGAGFLRTPLRPWPRVFL